jgi:hypothetical protein
MLKHCVCKAPPQQQQGRPGLHLQVVHQLLWRRKQRQVRKELAGAGVLRLKQPQPRPKRGPLTQMRQVRSAARVRTKTPVQQADSAVRTLTDEVHEVITFESLYWLALEFEQHFHSSKVVRYSCWSLEFLLFATARS